MSRFAKLWASAAIIPAIGLATPALADNYVINTDATTTNNGYDVNGSDSIMVTEFGSVTTDGDREHGLFATGDTNQLTNNGTVDVSGDNSLGMRATVGVNTLTNNGTLTTSGENGFVFIPTEHRTILLTPALLKRPAAMAMPCMPTEV